MPVIPSSATKGKPPTNHRSTAAAPQRQVHIAERISPADLSRLIKDLPGTFDLVDIRPADAFADYALPGSRRADLADVLENPGYLKGAGPSDHRGP